MEAGEIVVAVVALVIVIVQVGGGDRLRLRFVGGCGGHVVIVVAVRLRSLDLLLAL